MMGFRSRPFLQAFCFVLTAAVAWSSDREGADSGAAGYRKLGMGARALGMGNAATAVVDDANALYWNPALLAKLPNRAQLDTGSAALGDDRNFYSLAFAVGFSRPVDGGDAGESMAATEDEHGERRFFRPVVDEKKFAVGVGAVSYGVGEIGGRDDFGVELPSFSDKEAAYTLAFGTKVYEDFLFGVSADYMTQTLAGSQAKGMSYGGGFVWFTPADKWALSGAVRGMGGELKWEVDDPVTQDTVIYKESVQSSMSVGVARVSEKWTVALEARKYAEQDVELHAGIEVSPIEALSLRAGLNAYDPTVGVGLKIPLGLLDLSLQYAYQYDLEDFQSPHWTSVVLRF